MRIDLVDRVRSPSPDGEQEGEGCGDVRIGEMPSDFQSPVAPPCAQRALTTSFLTRELTGALYGQLRSRMTRTRKR